MGIANKVCKQMLLGVLLAAALCLAGAATAFAAESAPVVTKTDMSQAYSTYKQNHGYIFDDGKEVGKANRTYASWDGNTVSVYYKTTADGRDANCSVTYQLQRSVKPASGFSNVGEASWENSGCLTDKNVPRGKKYYYRVMARYDYYGQPDRSVDKPSNVVAVKTSPKTLALTSAKVKTSKGWSSKLLRSKKNASLFKKSKSVTFKLTWKKRTDVDGYYVYRVPAQFVKIKTAKAWQYPISDITLGPARMSQVTSSKLCKRVKTLKANATSYTGKLSNKSIVPYGKTPTYTYYYAVVPFVKQNGKVYLGDCKKVYAPSYTSVSSGRTPYVSMIGKPFKALFPFPLK